VTTPTRTAIPGTLHLDESEIKRDCTGAGELSHPVGARLAVGDYWEEIVALVPRCIEIGFIAVALVTEILE
jgi:hypothetical protein